jgi:hypothetical protein
MCITCATMLARRWRVIACKLIEQTGFGVRSAALTLDKPGSAVRFVLFPMLHLGTPAFTGRCAAGSKSATT